MWRTQDTSGRRAHHLCFISTRAHHHLSMILCFAVGEFSPFVSLYCLYGIIYGAREAIYKVELGIILSLGTMKLMCLCSVFELQHSSYQKSPNEDNDWLPTTVIWLWTRWFRQVRGRTVAVTIHYRITVLHLECHPFRILTSAVNSATARRWNLTEGSLADKLNCRYRG